jgi:hypothetical protein
VRRELADYPSTRKSLPSPVELSNRVEATTFGRDNSSRLRIVKNPCTESTKGRRKGHQGFACCPKPLGLGQ